MSATAKNELYLDDRDEQFLDAWKAGVIHAGEKLFGCQARTPSNATHWHQLTPILPDMRKTLPNRSRADAAFIGAMASFFNAEEGQKLLTKAGCTFGDVVTVLTPKQRSIIAMLMIHFKAWQ